MDFDWVNSLNLKPTEKWENVTTFGKTQLKASQKATLIKLLYPDVPYKYTQRSHWFKLTNISPLPK